MIVSISCLLTHLNHTLKDILIYSRWKIISSEKCGDTNHFFIIESRDLISWMYNYYSGLIKYFLLQALYKPSWSYGGNKT